MSSINKESRRIALQIVLFVVTFITTTLAGSEWCFGRSVFSGDYSWNDFLNGMYFSVPLLSVLTVHEFGHYFTAMYNKVRTSFPYYIPIPPIPGFPFFSIGTLGAVIRLRQRPSSNIQNFDIGLAGPLAGFILAMVFLFYGFSTLPPAEHIFNFHPEYKQYGMNYAEHVYKPDFHLSAPADSTHGSLDSARYVIDLSIGKNLLFLVFEQFVDDPKKVPNEHELMHFPILLAVYFALFFTSLNLLPIGQLDGGHVTYGLFGYRKHRAIASAFFIAIMFYAGIGNPLLDVKQAQGGFSELIWYLLYLTGYFLLYYVSFKGLQLSKQNTWMLVLLVIALQFVLALAIPDFHGYVGWVLLGFLLGRVVGIQHPPSEIEVPLDAKRVLLGWITLLIFILCFSISPIQIEILTR